jgi:hypothetical protein
MTLETTSSVTLKLLPIDAQTLLVSKETENKLRWSAKVNGIDFKIYIPKWRVPEPWPQRIIVETQPLYLGENDLPMVTRSAVKADPSAKSREIIATVQLMKKCTETIRYRPIGDPDEWGIGEPYLPVALTYGESPVLRVIVRWE